MARTAVLILCHMGNLIAQLVDFLPESIFRPTYVIQHGATLLRISETPIQARQLEFEFYAPVDGRSPVTDRR